MKKRILVLDSDKKQCQELCSLLGKYKYEVLPIYSLPDLEHCLKETDCIAALLDIDTVPVDNRTIRELTLANSGVSFLCLSRDRFHPDLKDAICYHIYACLTKPIDLDEFFYCINAIIDDESTNNNLEC